MEIIQVKFVTNVQSATKRISLTKPVKEALGIFLDADDHDLVIEVSSSKGTKTIVTRTTSGGETKESDFSEHVEYGELVTVTISKL